jgi:hypothetical protein
MLRIDVTDTIQPAIAKLGKLTETNIRFVVARAMTNAGKAAQQDLKQAMPRYIDRPNPWTLGSTFVQFAKASDLTLTVGIRDQDSRGRTGAAKYLMPIIQGGQPRPKGADLSASKIAGTRGVLIPATGGPVRLNQYGNVSLSNYAKILTAARTPGSGIYVAAVKRGSNIKAVFQRKEGFIGRTSTLESSTRRLFTIDPNPKGRSARFPVPQLLEASFRQAFPALLTSGLQAELARHFG